MAAIAQIVESFAFGTAKSVLQLCRFIGDEHRVTVFYGVRPGTEVDLSDVGDGVELIPLEGTGPTKHAQNIRFLSNVLRSGYDIAHGHSSFGGMYAKAVGPKHKLKTLYSPRGYSFLREDFPRVGRWLFRTAERATARRCTTVCCGPYEYRLSQELGAQSVRINNGFEIHQPTPVNKLQNVVLGVGRICPQKGFDLFRAVAAACPDLKFLWIGRSEDDELPGGAELPSNLQLKPYLPHHELLQQINRSRLILLPSRWEGLSRFLIESVCMGKAIVTSRFPGNLDCLDGAPEGDRFANGYACRTVGEYSTAVTNLMRDDELLSSMQTASHRFASSNFDIKKIAQQWRDLYQSLG